MGTKEEIEITPEIIEAGVEAYGAYEDDWDSLPEMLSAVFKAMIRAGTCNDAS